MLSSSKSFGSCLSRTIGLRIRLSWNRRNSTLREAGDVIAWRIGVLNVTRIEVESMLCYSQEESIRVRIATAIGLVMALLDSGQAQEPRQVRCQVCCSLRTTALTHLFDTARGRSKARPFAVEGVVKAVCAGMGCWMAVCAGRGTRRPDRAHQGGRGVIVISVDARRMPRRARRASSNGSGRTLKTAGGCHQLAGDPTSSSNAPCGVAGQSDWRTRVPEGYSPLRARMASRNLTSATASAVRRGSRRE